MEEKSNSQKHQVLPSGYIRIEAGEANPSEAAEGRRP